MPHVGFGLVVEIEENVSIHPVSYGDKSAPSVRPADLELDELHAAFADRSVRIRNFLCCKAQSPARLLRRPESSSLATALSAFSVR